MAAKKGVVVDGYARLWPRGVFRKFEPFFGKRTRGTLARELGFLSREGVYVLYRNDEPLYVGQAKKLGKRIWAHARNTGDPYYHFWNFFSAFAIKNKAHRDEVEGILISCMPTANGAKPRLKRQPIPPQVRTLLRELYDKSAVS